MKRLGLILSVIVLSTGCATIMHGTTQDVGISSSPTSARVTVDKIAYGQSPVVAKLSRKDNHVVRLELDGYAPAEMTLTRGTSGWVWGNLAFGGLIGLAVDAMSGGLYKLTPEQLQGTLAHQGASIAPTKDGIYVVMVHAPEAGWVKVGQLQAISQAVGE